MTMEQPTPNGNSSNPITLASLKADPIGVVSHMTSRFMSLAEKSASLAMMVAGALLIGVAVGAQIAMPGTAEGPSNGTFRHEAAWASIGEFLAVLFAGLLLLVLGASLRIYVAMEGVKAEREKAAWIRDRAAIEADAQLKRTGNLTDVATETPDQPLRPYGA